MFNPSLTLSNASLANIPAQGFNYLTPDALMTYCQSRLQGIDTQVQTAFALQEADNADATTLSTLAGSSALAAPANTLNLGTQADFMTAYNAYTQMVNTASTLQDPATKQALNTAAQQLYAKLNSAIEDMTGNKAQLSVLAGAAPNGDMNSFWSPGITIGATTYKPTGSTSQSITTDDWSNLVTNAVKNVSDDLNSNAELSMINLQALMSQRQEAVQVCTNLVQSLGDEASKVSDNVGK
jgi:hypothetical protein